MKWGDLKFFDKEWKRLSDYLEDVDFFPADHNIWKAFELTPFDEVKVVILGQDPYHTKGLAHGLAFSVQPHVKPLPPSLRNVLAEYQSDLGHPRPRTGDLSDWARRGVLLLNTILTVEEGKPLSHAGLGWEKLTYEALRSLSSEREGIVFLLWGKKAQEYKGAIDEKKDSSGRPRHCILEAPHPSPLSKGFRGCKHFSKANAYLGKENAIDWKLR